MNTFNADEFFFQIDVLTKDITPVPGLPFELYQRRVSAAIGSYIATLPAEHHDQAIELAREEFDYQSEEEISEEIRHDKENGICSHGFDHDCCPLGCGDLDDF
ncbi:CcgAII protein [Lonsdalea quercina]|uniref:CcgAII protein n=1 Tax=Lonsdalea quercina TaxID=71657 RepID=UPI00397627CE